MRMKSFKKKDGGFGILFVIISFIVVLVVTGFIDILGKSFAINEIQSIMDVAGTSSLHAGVDQTKLRVEIFEINQNFVKQSFKTQVTNLVNAGSGSLIESISIQNSDMKLSVINSSWGLGESSKSRPQAVLDVVARVRVKTSSVFDNMPSIQKVFYNSLSNSNFQVSYVGRTSDGRAELIVRSMSRIVYR